MKEIRSSLNLGLDLSQSCAAILLKSPPPLSPCPPLFWWGLYPLSLGIVEILECGTLKLSQGNRKTSAESLWRSR